MGIEIEKHAYIARLVKTLRDMIWYLASSVTYFSIGGLVIGLCLIAMSIPVPSEWIGIVIAVAAWSGVIIALCITNRLFKVKRRARGLGLWLAVSIAAIVAGSALIGFALAALGLLKALPTTWGFGVGLFLLCLGLAMRKRGEARSTSAIIVGSAMLALYPLVVVAALRWGIDRAQLFEMGILLVAYVFGGFYDLNRALRALLGEEGLGARERAEEG